MIENKVKHLLATQLGLVESDIALDSQIVMNLGADSLDLVEIVLALEKEFNVTIEVDEQERADTVSKIICLIKKKLAES